MTYPLEPYTAHEGEGCRIAIDVASPTGYWCPLHNVNITVPWQSN